MHAPDPLPSPRPRPVSEGGGIDRLVTAVALLATLGLIFLTPFG